MKLIQPVRLAVRAADLRTLKPDGLVQMKGGRTQLYLYGDVGPVFGGFGALDIQEALKSAKGDLDVFLSSDGGDAFEGVAIHNILARYPGKKTITVDGLAASAASVILMAGDERVMAAGSQVMVHGPYSGIIGNSKSLREKADMLDGVADSIKGIYLSRTKQSEEVVNAWLASNETFFNVEQAIAAGLADRAERSQPQVTNKIEAGPKLSPMDRARILTRARKA